MDEPIQPRREADVVVEEPLVAEEPPDGDGRVPDGDVGVIDLGVVDGMVEPAGLEAFLAEPVPWKGM